MVSVVTGILFLEVTMEWQKLIMEQFRRISQELENVLDGLTVDDLNHHPAPDCNSIGWLAWHLTRSHDRNVTELAAEEQVWIKDKWYLKFNRAPDPSETGVRHTSEDIAAFKSPESRVLLEYHRAVLERIENYINNRLSESELEREAHSPTLHTTFPVGRRLVGVISEGFQHVGQAAYVRGLLKGKGWLGR
jgi:hypothetical protein